MKKSLLTAIAVLTFGGVMAQSEPTIVSTNVEKRNVLIEEFTGVGCGYCPDGHYRANLICEQYKGHAWAINIHEGGYATGSGYTTTYGDNLAKLWNIQGYPCGVTNRCADMQNRGEWADAAVAVRAEDSPVNVACMGSFDEATRTATLKIEVYNTGETDLAAYMLNVAVIQNNIIGSQSNYGNYNPEYITADGKYRHMHMLREYLTGQWGVEISSEEGAFFDTTIVYTVPEAISGLAIPDPQDIEYIVFLTAPSHKNVVTAAKAVVPTENPSISTVVAEQAGSCSLEYGFTATINNNTLKHITGVTLKLEDGTEEDYTVDIPALGEATVNLPSATIEVEDNVTVQNCSYTRNVTIVGYSYEDGEDVTFEGNTASCTYGNFNIYTVTGPFHLRLGGDAYRTECGAQLLNQSNCQPLWSKNGFANSDINIQGAQYISDLPDVSMVEIDFQNTTPGLYILRLTDGYGDGWTMTNDSKPSGVWLDDANGSVIAEKWGYSNGISFTQLDYYLNITNSGDGSHTVGIDDVASVNFSVYPNPVRNQLQIRSDEPVRMIEVIDMNGRTVATAAATTTLDASALSAGVYVVRVTTESGIGMQRFIKE